MQQLNGLDVGDAAAGTRSAAYLLAGRAFWPETSASQALLAEAYLRRERPHCPCTPTGAPMYIAKVGVRLIVKRMPDTGSLHAPDCRSYAPEDRSGVGHLLGDAVRIDPDTGQRVLRLGFRLTVGARAARDDTAPAGAADNVANSGQRLSLRALLDFLWHEADLVAWSPGMAGHRRWGLVAWLLRQAASTARVKGHPLGERVYVPEPFLLQQKAELAARRLSCWQKTAARPGHAQQLMVLIGEVKSIEPARGGHKLVLKHLPDAPLFLDEGRHRRLTRRFAREIDMWNTDEDGHLVAIATFMVGRAGSATAQEVALMPTTAQWLPYRDPYSKILLDTLVEQRRRFRATLRFGMPPEVDGPAAVLTDCREPQPLHVCSRAPASLETTDPGNGDRWTWEVTGPLPPLPQPRR